MALRFKNKKIAKEALAAQGTLGRSNIIETSIFAPEYRDGTHGVVVSIEPSRVRNSYATITIRDGRIVSIK